MGGMDDGEDDDEGEEGDSDDDENLPDLEVADAPAQN